MEKVKIELELDSEDVEELKSCEDAGEYLSTDHGADLIGQLETRLEEIRLS